MIKDKLHTITDEDAQIAAELLLKSHLPYDYTFVKVTRHKHDPREGCDAEESVDVHFEATVKADMYRSVGWTDETVMVKLIEHDRYHDHPYFSGLSMKTDAKVWSHLSLANYIEAIEFLQSKQYL